MSPREVIDEVLDEINAGRMRAVGEIDSDPERAARSYDLAKIAGIPASVVYGDFDNFEREQKASLAGDLVAGNQRIADYIARDPMHARISSDDYAGLDEASQTFSRIGDKSAFGRITDAFKAGFDYDQAEKEYGRLGEAVKGAADWIWDRPVLIPAGIIGAGVAALPAGGLATLDAFMRVFRAGQYAAGAGAAEGARAVGVSDAWANRLMRDTIQGIDVLSSGALPTAPKGTARVGMAVDMSLAEANKYLNAARKAEPYALAGVEPPRGLDPLFDKLKAEQNTTDIDNLLEAVKAAQQSTTRSRNPDIFAGFLRSHSDASIGVDANAIAKLYGDKPPHPDDGLLGWVPGLGEKLEAAVASGGDVQIPLADWVAKVDPKVMQDLTDDIRVRPGNITKTEAKLASEIDLAEMLPPESHLDTIRDAAGLEPLFQMPERKLTLKRVQEITSKDLGRALEEPSFHEFEFIDDKGDAVGYVMLSEEVGGKSLYIEDIAATFGPRGEAANTVGPRLMRDILRQIKEQFPNAEELRGHRVSGARDRAGTWETHGMAGIKLDEFHPDSFRAFNAIIEDAVRFQLGKQEVAFLPKALTDAQRPIADAITEELNRIIPKQIAHAPASKLEFGGRTVQGFYKPFADQYPVLLWSLAADDPRVTARHEALHHLRQQGFFTANEWSQLSDAAKAEGWLKKYDIDARYLDLGEGAKIEEAIAEAFGEWRSGKLKVEGQLAQLFERIKELLERVAYRVKEILGRDLSVDEIFEAIERGQIGAREGNAPMTPGAFTAKAQQRGRDRIMTAAPQSVLDRLPEKVGEGRTALNLTPEESADLRKAGVFAADDGTLSGADISRLVQERDLRIQKAKPRKRGERDTQLDFGDALTPMAERDPFKSAAAIGMTEAQMEKYRQRIAQRLDEDTEHATKKAFEDEKRRQTNEWKENAARVRAEVVAEYNNRPDVSAEEYFRTGVLYGEQLKNKDGSPATLPKLDTDLVTPEQKAQLPLNFVAKDGIHPDDVAGLFGFPDGQALINSMINYHLQRVASALRPEEFKRALIQAEVDRRMERQFGNLQENILESVKERVLSDTQLDMLHEEVFALATPEWQLSITKEQIRGQAEAFVHAENLWTVSSDAHLAAAGKAGKAAEMALLKDDPHTAFLEKQKQYIAIIEAKEAMRVEKAWASFEKFAKRYREREIKNVNQEYVDYIQTLLTQAGVVGKRSAPELADALSRRDYASFDDFVQRKAAEGWEPAVSPSLRANAPKPLDQMTVAEFLDFKAAVDSLNHIGRAVNKIEVAGKAMEFEFFKGEVIRNITTLPVRSLKHEKNIFYWADASLTKMEEMIKDLDLRKQLGPLYNAVIRPVQEAKSREYTMLDDLGKRLREIKGDFGKAWQKTLNDTIPQDFLVDPWTSAPYDLTRQGMINIMLNFGNRSNIEKFTKGWVHNRANLSGKQLDVAASQLEMRLRMLFDRHASKQDWDYAQHIWDIFEGWRKQADDLSYRVSGVGSKWITPETVRTPHGTYAGGYFPIIYDRRRSGINVAKERATGDELLGPNYYRASTPKGYLAERTGHVDYIQIDNTLEQTAARMRQTIHDISHREAVMNVSKVLYDEEIRGAIRKHYGAEYEAQLSPWIRDVANHLNLDEVANAWGNWILRTARMNLIVHALGFNLRVILSPSVGTQGPLAPIVGLFTDKSAPQAKSLEFKHTMRTLDRDMREQMERTIEAGGWKGLQADVARWSFWPMLKVEEGLRARTWNQTYVKALRDGVEEPDAIALADSALRTRHGSAGMADLPAILRGGEFQKLTTLFFGYFNTVYNWQRQIPGQLKRGEWMAAMGTTYGAILVPAFFGALFFNQQREGDSWFKTIAKALALQPLQTVPFMREAANYMIEGFPPRTPLESIITAFTAAATDVKNYLNRKPVKKGVQHGANVAGMGLGLPLGQIGRTSQFVYDVNTGRQRPRNITEWMRGIINGEAKLKR